MADAARKQVFDLLKSSLASGAYSDLTITCGSDTYKVHKVIVCGRSEFFARAVSFGGQESQSNVIDLPEDEPNIVKKLVQYFYESDYQLSLIGASPVSIKNDVLPRCDNDGVAYSYSFPHTCESLMMRACDESSICPHHTCGTHCDYDCRSFTCNYNCQNQNIPPVSGTSKQLLIHAKMYEIAEKYDVAGLKDLAIEKFSVACHYFWDDDQFAIAAQHVYSSTPDEDTGLRSLVDTTIYKHLELVGKPKIKAIMAQSNGLALGVLEKVIENNQEISKSTGNKSRPGYY